MSHPVKWDESAEGNKIVGLVDESWFEDVSEADLHLKGDGLDVFGGFQRQFKESEFDQDFDEEPRPDNGYVGYDEPN